MYIKRVVLWWAAIIVTGNIFLDLYRHRFSPEEWSPAYGIIISIVSAIIYERWYELVIRRK